MTDGDRVGSERRRRTAVLAGDEHAWRTWYDAHWHELRSFVHWRCGGLAHSTDEVVQETWLAAIRRIRSFDPARGNFRAWLFGIAANCVRDRLRHERVARHRVAALVADPPARTDQADSSLEDRSLRIAQTLVLLPPRCEQVLRAKYLEQLSVQAIAEARGETVKAVESLLTRARQAFREAYHPAGGSDG